MNEKAFPYVAGAAKVRIVFNKLPVSKHVGAEVVVVQLSERHRCHDLLWTLCFNQMWLFQIVKNTRKTTKKAVPVLSISLSSGKIKRRTAELYAEKR